jgi:hypothetical protein
MNPMSFNKVERDFVFVGMGEYGVLYNEIYISPRARDHVACLKNVRFLKVKWPKEP